MISDFGTHISPSKTYFAMPISLYLKRPLLSLSVFTFTIYSIDICSFTELKKNWDILRVLCRKITIVYIFFIPQHFFHVSNSRGCYIFEIFLNPPFLLLWISPKKRLTEYFSWIYYLIFTCCWFILRFFLRSKQFIIRTLEEKTCYCFVPKADNKTELSKNNKNLTFPVFLPSF